MSLKVICEENCEGAKRPSGGGSGRGPGGVPLPGQRKMYIWSKKKTVSDAYLGKDYLEYDFLVARGQDDNIKL